MISPCTRRKYSRALVLAAKRGDQQAIEVLLTGPGRLRATVESIKNECDPSREVRDAWDPMPEEKRPDEAEAGARIGILEALARFNPDRGVDFVTYAYHFIRGEVLRALYPTVHRRSSKTRHMTLVPITSGQDEGITPEFESDLLARDPEYGREAGYDRLVDLEQRRAVRRFKASLPANQREVIHEIFWNERTQDEVAEMRKVSRQAVSKSVQKVFKRARVELETVAA